MRRARLSFLIFIFLVKINPASAQDLTGTWEGTMGTYQYLQVNIIQVSKTQLCGYTWDRVKADSLDHCKANFEAHFNRREKKWIINGTSFIESSSGHTLMHLILEATNNKGKMVLTGFEGLRFTEVGRQADPDDNLATDSSENFDIYLEKKSDQPTMITSGMKDCMKEKEKITRNAATRVPVVISNSGRQNIDSIVSVLHPKDNPVNITKRDDIIIAEPDSVSLKNKMELRKNREEGRLTVTSRQLKLYVYDNAIIDGDTVSIFYDDQLIISHKLLSVKPIEIDITLDEMKSEHRIILYAENLGSIPPNTALVVVMAGGKRYELFSRASLEENAVLVFEYKPL
jgi:hypothetical protein